MDQLYFVDADAGSNLFRRGGHSFTCKNKIPYLNKRHAKKKLAKLAQKKGGSGKLHIYRCEHCGFFHLGHKKKP